MVSVCTDVDAAVESPMATGGEIITHGEVTVDANGDEEDGDGDRDGDRDRARARATELTDPRPTSLSPSLSPSSSAKSSGAVDMLRITGVSKGATTSAGLVPLLLLRGTRLSVSSVKMTLIGALSVRCKAAAQSIISCAPSVRMPANSAWPK